MPPSASAVGTAFAPGSMPAGLTPAQQTAFTNVGKAFSTAPTTTSTPSAFSSTAGAASLAKTQAQAAKLAGVPATPTTETTPASDKGGAPTTQTSVTLVKPETGQEYTLTSPDANTVSSFTSNGWNIAEGKGDGAGVIPTDPAVKAAQDATDQAKGELDNAKAKLTSFAPSLASDPMLANIMNSITTDWDTRMEEMSKYNASATADMQTTAYRNGLQYTGGMGGTWGGVISSEERAGVDRLTTLEAEKQQALTNASLAYEKQKWTEYSDLVDKAQTAYDTQVTELQKLQTASQAQNDKIATAKRQASLEGVVSDAVKQGMTDPGDIQAYLRSIGANDALGNISLSEIGSALKVLNPAADLTGLTSDYKTFSYMQSRGDPAVKGMSYLDYVRAVHNASRAPAKGSGSNNPTGTPTGPSITWDAFLKGQEEKMQANIVPGSKLFNDLHTQWEQSGGGASASGKSPFTIKDQANGAQNAGVPIANFPALPLDVQNFYVKAPQAQINALNKQFEAVRSGADTAANVKKWVGSSQITDSMKDYLNRKIDEISSSTPAGGASGGSTGGGIMSELGSGWHALTNFLGV